MGNILYDPHTGKFALIDFDSAQIIPVVGESLSAGKVKTIRQNLNHVFNEAERALKSSQSSVLSDLDEVSGNSWGSMLERIPIIGNIIQVRNIK
ncbi:hypothetical protein, partial [Vibrio anguillarum]|uniref:hypothetical protein n=1 Tax=Vibrio anguillarum TaxID=55601 RepID=UPI001C03B2E7|nr:hypothetical protein [Vibrio anguillarum]